MNGAFPVGKKYECARLDQRGCAAAERSDPTSRVIASGDVNGPGHDAPRHRFKRHTNSLIAGKRYFCFQSKVYRRISSASQESTLLYFGSI